MKKLERLFRYFIYILPLTLFFSYYPIISLGNNQSMNFELSLPLIWLVLFDLLSFIILIKKKELFKNFGKKWLWLLFPGYLTVSVFWSLNSLRGILTVGILWLIYFAGYSLHKLRRYLSDLDFKKTFWRWFLGSTLLICGWCFMQCIIDLIGVSRDYSLMCAGCVYEAFGFPHPNGFSIEPQFMGNLLLVPVIISFYFLLNKKYVVKKAYLIVSTFIFTITLFLTFSRGAIYALIIALIAMSLLMIFREKKKRVEVVKRAGMMFGVLILSFLFTLNLQGIMAEVSPTNDSYRSGVAKVLNHLSLGIIDIREKKQEPVKEDVSENTEGEGMEPEEKEAIFDGYVEASTNIRVKVSESALKVYKKDLRTIIFGVGIGGAGQALYLNNLSSAPKEIVQNQYVSLLLETGLMGIALLVLTIVLIIKVVLKNSFSVVFLSIMVAYGITLLFFSGLANALQIYLWPIVLFFILRDEKS